MKGKGKPVTRVDDVQKSWNRFKQIVAELENKFVPTKNTKMNITLGSRSQYGWLTSWLNWSSTNIKCRPYKSFGRMTFGRHDMDSWATKLLTDGKPYYVSE